MGCLRGVTWNHHLLLGRLTGALQSKCVFSMVIGSYDARNLTTLVGKQRISKRLGRPMMYLSKPEQLVTSERAPVGCAL